MPGVGRNALLRDPLGALIGLALSRHNFPAPRRQFEVDVYFSEGAEFPAEFYSNLFEWTVSTRSIGKGEGTPIVGPSGEQVALHLTGMPQGGGTVWIPRLRTDQVDRASRDAEELGARSLNQMLSEPAQQRCSFLHDPDGASICLSKA